MVTERLDDQLIDLPHFGCRPCSLGVVSIMADRRRRKLSGTRTT